MVDSISKPTIVRLPIWLMFISLFWKFTLLPSFIDALDSISGISSDAFLGRYRYDVIPHFGNKFAVVLGLWTWYGYSADKVLFC